jgi:glutamate carboxypeptidase
VGLKSGEAPLQGGGSDGNLLAAAGVPTLDGLGPFGEYFHETREWCSLESLARRTEALTIFLSEAARPA